MRIRSLNRIPYRSADGHGEVTVQRIARIGSTELKVINVAAGVATDTHRHAHAHYVVVIGGRGSVASQASRRSIGSDDVVAIEPEEWHGLAADPDSPLRFICLDAPPRR